MFSQNYAWGIVNTVSVATITITCALCLNRSEYFLNISNNTGYGERGGVLNANHVSSVSNDLNLLLCFPEYAYRNLDVSHTSHILVFFLLKYGEY